MTKRPIPIKKLTKVQDERNTVRCDSGYRAIMRIEEWKDDTGSTGKYRLAFIHHLLCAQDNGRVVGYDNAHGMHERHWMGTVMPVPFISFEHTLERFINEVEELRASS